MTRNLAMGFLCLLLCMFSIACCQQAEENDVLTVTLVTDTSGIGDKGFNEITWKGLQRARDDFGIIIKKIESSDPSNYHKNLATSARFGDLTIGNGFLIQDALKEVSARYPESDFIFIDGVIEAKNVASYTFRSEEIGFVVGVLASGMSRSHRTGVLKGMSIPPVEAFEYGFRAGSACADLTWEHYTDIRSVSAGDFNDPQKGFTITQQFLNDGRDIIFQLAGATALGAINAIKNYKSHVYLIGVDLDQDDEIPGRVLTSALKRIDVAVYEAVRAKLEGKFKGGHYSLGISQGALSLTDMRHTRQNVSAEIREAVALAESLIRGDKVTLPARAEEFAGFKPFRLREE